MVVRSCWFLASLLPLRIAWRNRGLVAAWASAFSPNHNFFCETFAACQEPSFPTQPCSKTLRTMAELEALLMSPERENMEAAADTARVDQEHGARELAQAMVQGTDRARIFLD